MVAIVGLRANLRRLLLDVSYRLDRSLAKPTSVILDITDRCCLKCATCSKWMVQSPDGELSTEEWQAVIVDLRRWLGPFHLSISGGEPFMRRDLLDIVGFAAGLGATSSVISNGYLIGDKLARQIASSGLRQLTISLNGNSAAVHDPTRGMAGSYDRAVRAIKAVHAVRPGELGLSVSTVLMGHNRDDILPLIEWVREMGLTSIGFQALDDVSSFHGYRASDARYDDRWFERDKLLTTDPDAMDRLLDEIARLKRAGYPISNGENHLNWMKRYFRDPAAMLKLPCKVAQTNFSIDPYGEVRLCFNMDSIGKSGAARPNELWRSPRAAEQRRRARLCRRTCRLLNCNFQGEARS